MIGNLLRQAVKRKYEESEIKGLSVSKIGYCPRKIVKDFLEQHKQDIPVNNLVRMLIGTGAHAEIEKIFDYLEGAEVLLSEELLEININGFVIRGKPDALFKLNDENILVDFKFVGHNHFQHILLSQEAPNHYKDQIIFYKYMIETLKQISVDKMLLLFFDIDPASGNIPNFVEIEVRPSEKRLQELIEKVKVVNEAIKNKTLPEVPADYSPSYWECRYCDYYEDCWGSEGVELETEELAEIPDDLAEQYISLDEHIKKLKAELKDAENMMEYVKSKIIETTRSQKAFNENYNLIMTYVQPKPRYVIDKEKLELEYSDVFEKVLIEKPQKGYYRFRRKK